SIYYPLYYGSVGGEGSGNLWNDAFFLGALIAVVQSIYYVYNHISFDYIALGCNVFLIGGALTSLGAYPFILLYEPLKQSTLFFCISVVGLIATFGSRTGFIQTEQSPVWVRKRSLLLLAGSIGIGVISLVLSVGLDLGKFGATPLTFILLLWYREMLRKI
ncbi:hypothetical protein H0W26_02085, partial [Candidatus Dependentiae bacterium]|nr:hypothetical protein [Candidatus Dependentiae bacterium]